MQSSAVGSQSMPHSHPPHLQMPIERQQTVCSSLSSVSPAFMEVWCSLRTIFVSWRRLGTIFPLFCERGGHRLLWSRSSLLTPPLGLAVTDQQRSIDLLPLIVRLCLCQTAWRRRWKLTPTECLHLLPLILAQARSKAAHFRHRTPFCLR
jgi:hypothetical protein